MKKIHYALIPTGWGVAAVLCTRRGVAGFVWPAKSADRARRQVARLAPQAEPVDPKRLPGGLARRLADYFAGRAVDFSAVPVDLSAMPRFRADVLAALCRIPYGRTTSYGRLARRIGRARAARAVGQAVGANPIPVIVPCHRVLRTDGGLGGFSADGGVAMKKRLLQMEQQGVRRRPDR